MEKNHLQYNVLSKPYERELWIDTLKVIFAGIGKNLHIEPPSIPLLSNEIAESAAELGKLFTTDEREIGIYEIILKQDAKTKLAINRVGLKNLLRNVYKYYVDGALIVFVQGNKWRFSYVSEIITEDGKKETEPKRYTYLFGKGESCRTAADRFYKLIGNPVFLNDLYEAFSVEKLNKEFFKTYKDFFERFSNHLAKDKEYRRLFLGTNDELGKGWKDDNAKPIRDFSKKLLGRIVFLQFLQKKGWMGVPKENDEWKGGDTRFMFSLFEFYPDKEHFHSKALKSLFFETLNTKRKNDIAPNELGKNIKIPYLNGGLFDKDISFEYTIDFPSGLFFSLFDFFEQYNFTIDENDPYDSEIGIDPEMLGHIFENLLEENREKGAFYTPKEIVHYMCQESLIQYLRTHLPECTEDQSPATKALENFIRSGVTGDRNDKRNFVVQQASRIEKLLDSVKICDPAIGSGAFPMGILQEIFKVKTALDLTLDHAEIKKQIIQNCIYGVDIDNGAVDIARLRFWLALVVDENEPQPLPNLDFKIMQGNSLLENFEGVDLSNLSESENEEAIVFANKSQLELGAEFSKQKQTLLIFDQKSKLQLYELINDYFNFEETSNAKYPNKQFIKDEINKIVEGKLIAKFYLEKPKVEKRIEEIKSNIGFNQVSATDDRGKRAKKERNIEKLARELVERQKEWDKLTDIIAHLHELQTRIDKPYFLWHLWFKEVFDSGGFDIIIGNPPYFNIQALGAGSNYARQIQNTYQDIWMDKSDILFYFIRKGVALCRNKGHIFYIISNAFLFSDKAQKLRNFILETAPIQKIINFENHLVFDSAMITTAMVNFKKGEPNRKARAFVYREDTNKDVYNLFFNDGYFIDVWLKPNSSFALINDRIEKLNSKIDKGSMLLGSIFLVGKGMETAANDIFSNKDLLNFHFPSRYIKRRLNGKAIKKFFIDDKYNEDILFFEEINSFDELDQTIKSYLIENREELEKRATVKNEGRSWWRYSRPMHKEYYNKNKIWTSYRNGSNCFALDFSNTFIGLTNTTVIFQTNPQIDITIVCAILNSRLLTFRYRSIGKQTGGGIFEYFENGVSRLPIKMPEETQSALIAELVKKVIYYYDFIEKKSFFENKLDALIFHQYQLTEDEMLDVLDTFRDLSIKDRNQIQNEFWNIANNKFQLDT